MTGYPRIPYQALQDEVALEAFLETMTWVVAELRAASEPTRG
jgi:hypothetical protein